MRALTLPAYPAILSILQEATGEVTGQDIYWGLKQRGLILTDTAIRQCMKQLERRKAVVSTKVDRLYRYRMTAGSASTQEYCTPKSVAISQALLTVMAGCGGKDVSVHALRSGLRARGRIETQPSVLYRMEYLVRRGVVSRRKSGNRNLFTLREQKSEEVNN